MMDRARTFLLPALVLALIVGITGGCAVGIGLKKDRVKLAPDGKKPERTPVYEHKEWTIARASLHNHTTFSDGCRSPEDLLDLARRQGMAVLAITDHREGRICTSDNELMCAKVGGIEEYGYDTYFDHLSRLQETARAHDMLLVKGVEVFPYFYNYGKFPYLVLDGLQHHFVVYGIEDPEVYADMPARQNISMKPEPIPGATPWQRWVDYIVENNGIVHAAHVEEGRDMWVGSVHGACPPPIKNIHRIKRLTGFSVFPDGWHEKAGGAGGLWDTVLIEYLSGMRERPMWANADADYHGPDKSLAWATTLLYMTEFTEAEVLRCMREGRMVALMGPAYQDTYVAEWSVSGSGPAESSMMAGREIRLDQAPRISFALDHPVEGTVIELIRNGEVIKKVKDS
ncbi:MAG: PHP domain-containing protein, partial [bacterium]